MVRPHLCHLPPKHSNMGLLLLQNLGGDEVGDLVLHFHSEMLEPGMSEANREKNWGEG